MALPMALGAVLGILVFLWIYIRAYLEHPAFPSDQLVGQLTSIHPWAWRQLSDIGELIGVYQPPSVRGRSAGLGPGVAAGVCC